MLLLPSSLHYAKLLNSCASILMNSEPRPTREAPQRAITFWSVLIITHQERRTPQDSFLWFWLYAHGSSVKRSPVSLLAHCVVLTAQSRVNTGIYANEFCEQEPLHLSPSTAETAVLQLPRTNESFVTLISTRQPPIKQTPTAASFSPHHIFSSGSNRQSKGVNVLRPSAPRHVEGSFLPTVRGRLLVDLALPWNQHQNIKQ